MFLTCQISVQFQTLLWGFSKLHIDWLAYVWVTDRLFYLDLWSRYISYFNLHIWTFEGWCLAFYSQDIHHPFCLTMNYLNTHCLLILFPIHPCICYRITATPLLFWTVYNMVIYRLRSTDKNDVTLGQYQYELSVCILSFYPLVAQW